MLMSAFDSKRTFCFPDQGQGTSSMTIILAVSAIALSLGIWAVVGELRRLRAEMSRIARGLEQGGRGGQ